jgi:hypothetical protein
LDFRFRVFSSLVSGVSFRVSPLAFLVSPLGFRHSDFGFWISDLGFRLSGLEKDLDLELGGLELVPVTTWHVQIVI